MMTMMMTMMKPPILELETRNAGLNKTNTHSIYSQIIFAECRVRSTVHTYILQVFVYIYIFCPMSDPRVIRASAKLN